MTEQEKHRKQLQVIRQMHRRQMLLLGTIILAAGVVIGSGATAVYYETKKPSRPAGIENINERAFPDLKTEYQLTDEQDEQIKKIFQNHFKALHEIRMKARPQVAAEINSMNEKVLEVLDEEQAAKWTENMNRLRDRFNPRKRMRRGPDDGGEWKRRRDGNGNRGPRPFDFWQEQDGKTNADGGDRPRHRRRQFQQDGEGPLPEDLPEDMPKPSEMAVPEEQPQSDTVEE